MSDETAAQPIEGAEGLAKYAHLRANVARRRGLYLGFVLFAIVVFAGTLADILYLKAAGMYGLFGAYGLLILWAFLMYFSRARTEALVEELRSIESQLMQCPACKGVFQFGQVHLQGRNRTAFSCPVCGEYNQMPDPEQEAVKVLRPEGDFKEVLYHCNHCDEDLNVGTYGETPLHLVRFRACPNCGEKGHVEKVGAHAPLPETEPWSNPA